MALNRLHDRCDRCGSQAFVRVASRRTGFDLLLCGHHFARYKAALDGWAVDDQRDQINAAPSPSASVDGSS